MKKHQHGGDIYSRSCKTDFSANINPLGPPPGVLRGLEKSASMIQNYPDVSQRRLRSALAEHENVKPEHLIFGNGAAELIFALAQGCRPKKALLAVPGFAEYEEALSSAGCEISCYDLREENGYLIEEDYLEMITEELDMLFLCNPNNPTGTLTDRELLLKIAQKCREKQVLMVVDECFNSFIDEPEQYTLKPWLEEYPNLFLLKAFTKLYAMPGLRLGYGLCSNPEIMEQLLRVMQPWSVSIPAQEAGIEALKEEEYVARSRELVRRERGYLTEELGSLGFTVWEGAANYIFFKGPAQLDEKCREQGYLIRNCNNYRGLEEGYYRIAVRTEEENRAFIEVLKEIVKREDR